MRLRTPSRRRAIARHAAVTNSSLDPQTRDGTAVESLVTEADQSHVHTFQEMSRHDRPLLPRRSVKRLRTPARIHYTSNDEYVTAEADDRDLPKRSRKASRPEPTSTSYYCLLQTAFAHEDRIDDTNWLTSTLIDLMLWRLATQYTDVHFLATDFCHLHLPSIAKKTVAETYDIRDVLGRCVEATASASRPIVFVANVSHIHWNLLRVQFHPHAELQLFEPMGRLSSRSGLSYRSVPRCVIGWLDACYPQPKSWLCHSVSAITRPQQVSGFDCGVACLLYADKCGQGQRREAINDSTDQHEITTFRTELQRQLESELRPFSQENDSPSDVGDLE